MKNENLIWKKVSQTPTFSFQEKKKWNERLKWNHRSPGNVIFLRSKSASVSNNPRGLFLQDLPSVAVQCRNFEFSRQKNLYTLLKDWVFKKVEAHSNTKQKRQKKWREINCRKKVYYTWTKRPRNMFNKTLRVRSRFQIQAFPNKTRYPQDLPEFSSKLERPETVQNSEERH